MNIASSKKYISYRKANRFWFWNTFIVIAKWIFWHSLVVLSWVSFGYLCKDHMEWAALMFLVSIALTLIVGCLWATRVFNCFENSNGKTEFLCTLTCNSYVKVMEKYFFKDIRKAISSEDITGIADLLSAYAIIERTINYDKKHKLTLSKTFAEVYTETLNVMTESKQYEDLTVCMLIEMGTDHYGFDTYEGENQTLSVRYREEFLRDTYPRIERTYAKYVDIVKTDFWNKYYKYYKQMHLADIDATAYMLENRYKYLREHRVDNLEWTYSHILHPAMRIEDYTMTQTDTERKDA